MFPTKKRKVKSTDVPWFSTEVKRQYLRREESINGKEKVSDITQLLENATKLCLRQRRDIGTK